NDRFQSVVEKIGRALHFHHFGEKWIDDVATMANFISYFGGKNSASANDQRSSINLMSRQLFSGTKPIGENSDVFTYNVKIDPKGSRAIRANFYGDAQITYLFKRGMRQRPS